MESNDMEKVSAQLKRILDAHKRGEPVLREMAARIEARRRQEETALIREAGVDIPPEE